MVEPTLKDLLMEQEKLDYLLDVLDEKEWLEKAIPLYRQLVRANPQEPTYQQQLMKYLLSYGGDLKMRQHNYHQAEKVFQELVRLDRDHVLAYYRLGFLAYYQKKWESAATRFQHALQRRPRGTRVLTKEQRMNALLYQTRCYKNLLEESMSQLEHQYQKMDDAALINKLEPKILQLKREVMLQEEDKYYVYISPQGREYLNREELENIQDQLSHLPPEALYLDLLGNGDQCICKTSIHQVRLGRQRAKLLHYLIENRNSPVPHEDLRNHIGLNSRRSNVRGYITRVKQSIQPCFLEDANQLIINRDGGYQWKWSGEYYIFYRRDELEWNELEV